MSPTLKGKQVGEAKRRMERSPSTAIKQCCSASWGQLGPEVCSHHHQHLWKKKIKTKILTTNHLRDTSRSSRAQHVCRHLPIALYWSNSVWHYKYYQINFGKWCSAHESFTLKKTSFNLMNWKIWHLIFHQTNPACKTKKLKLPTFNTKNSDTGQSLEISIWQGSILKCLKKKKKKLWEKTADF